jgi:glycosyltransferase involved in cell wall biosynthesis
MKILVVNKFFWEKGGSERVMFDLLRGYEEAGHDVVPFAMASARNRPTPWDRFFVPEVDYVDVRGLAALGAAARAVYSREAKRRVTALVGETRPDVCHLHNFHHQLSPSVVDGLRAAGVPCVHTLHDYKVVCPSYVLFTEGRPCERCRGGRFHHAIRHRCVRGAVAPSAAACVESTLHRARRTLERGIRVFVAPSRFLAAKVAAMGFRPEVRVVANGLDVGASPVAAAAGEGFLYAGRLSREKGIATLVDAVGRAGGVRLEIAGDGPERASLARHAERVAAGRVTFLGALPRERLLERVRAARAVVLPSEWYENAPMAALEALASAVPVVASAIGGLPEIVRDGETGLLFPPGSAAELAARLERLERDAALARRLGEGGRRLVEREHRLEDQVARMLDILSEVASSASR